MSSISDALSKSLAHVTQAHTRDKKAAERSGARSYSRSWYREPRDVLKYHVFKVLPEAIAIAGSNGAFPFKERQLFYQVRPLLQKRTDKELTSAYFSPTLITEYEDDNGPIPGLLYDARGNFSEPHTGVRVPLGTAEVAGYTIPTWTYDKILYIEKEGFDPVLKAAKFSERFDIGVAGGKGYSTRAAKDLLAMAEAHDVAVLVFHDCDVYGYEIARTLAEATRTRPDHSLDIIDIGLSVTDVSAMGLATEDVVLKNRSSWEFESRLTTEERAFFFPGGYNGRNIPSQRCELNAMTSEQFISFLEKKLKAHGLDEKVIPPADDLAEQGAKHYQEQIAKWVEDKLAELLDLDDLKNAIAEQFEEAMQLSESRGWITEAFAKDRTQSWRAALDAAIRDRLDDRDDDLDDTLKNEIKARLDESS